MSAVILTDRFTFEVQSSFILQQKQEKGRQCTVDGTWTWSRGGVATGKIKKNDLENIKKNKNSFLKYKKEGKPRKMVHTLDLFEMFNYIHNNY